MPARKKKAPASKKAAARTKASAKLLAKPKAWPAPGGNVPVNPKGWPKPVGPFSQAIQNGNHLFVTGQGPLDPATGKFVLVPIDQQTRITLTNIQTILEAAGGTMDDVTMVSVHLADLTNFAAMNAVYAEFFATVPPARVTVG